ncbi:hypothetical protein [Asanoa siamensis]|uniref:Secreted protein n=1 Tax=Asanoa siamensis TaxID=926357 RepID=A0ABQ4D1P8_9ACTN|nr:hypothetical protein [Asanoa siamensis]GIF77436.1 hypothetical protein Asi02nite_69540 [Asanoa siamensis]
MALAAPGAAQAAPPPPLPEEVGVAASYAGARVAPWRLTWQARGIGSVDLWVYADHTKVMQICNTSEQDGLVPVLEVDPSGSAAPINYETRSSSRCLRHTIGYSVRKVRVSVWGPATQKWFDRWYATPVLKHPDF